MADRVRQRAAPRRGGSAPAANVPVGPLPDQAAALLNVVEPVPKQPKETKAKKRARELEEAKAKAVADQEEESRLAELVAAKQRKRDKAAAKAKEVVKAKKKKTQKDARKAVEAAAAFPAYKPTARERAVEEARAAKAASVAAAKPKAVVAKAKKPAQLQRKQTTDGGSGEPTEEDHGGDGEPYSNEDSEDKSESSESEDSSLDEESDAAEALAGSPKPHGKRSSKPLAAPLAKRNRRVSSDESDDVDDEASDGSNGSSVLQVISPQEAQLQAATFLVTLHKAGILPPFSAEMWLKCFKHSSAIWVQATRRSGLTLAEAPSRGRQPTVVLWRAAQSLSQDILRDAAGTASSRRGADQAPQASIPAAPAFPMVSHPSAKGTTVMLKASKATVVAVVFGNPPYEYQCSPASRLPVAAYLAAQYSGSSYCDVFGDKDAMDILGKRMRLDRLHDTAAQVIQALQTGKIQSFRHFAPSEGVIDKLLGPLSLRQLEKALDNVFDLFSEFLGLDTLFLSALKMIKKTRWLEVTYEAAVKRVAVIGGSAQAARAQAGAHLLECLDTAMDMYQNQVLELLDEHFKHPDSTVGIPGWVNLGSGTAPRGVTGINLQHSNAVSRELSALSFWKLLGATPAFVAVPSSFDHHNQSGAHGSARASKSGRSVVAKAPQPFTGSKALSGGGHASHNSAGGLAQAVSMAGGRKSVTVANPLVVLPAALQALLVGDSTLKDILRITANKALLRSARQVGSEDRLCHADLLFPGSCENGAGCPFKHVIRAATA